MSFDPMAAAVDWLDAYRAGDIEALLSMYTDDAVIHCGCGGLKTVTGKSDLRAYWTERLRDYPASDLNDIHPTGDGTMISYVAGDATVSAVLTFDRSGQIRISKCGPSG
jgi:hypothetical protein